MSVATVVLSVLLIAVLVVSAVAKLARAPAVVASIIGVGWPADRLWVLAVIELLGAVGLLVGWAVAPLGVAAAVGATLYFLAAVIAHLRLRQPPNQALGPLAIAAATAVVLVIGL